MLDILQLRHLRFNAKEGFLETSSWLVVFLAVESAGGWARLDFLRMCDDVCLTDPKSDWVYVTKVASNRSFA